MGCKTCAILGAAAVLCSLALLAAGCGPGEVPKEWSKLEEKARGQGVITLYVFKYTGYPDGLKREKIPLASRIIAVADAYDAMTTDRPYRKAKTREEAIEELRRCAGTQFDPQVVEAFLRMMEE
ncbi:MAG: HD domain-containing phosphohydrolase [Anaerolineae bacterium]